MAVRVSSSHPVCVYIPRPAKTRRSWRRWNHRAVLRRLIIRECGRGGGEGKGCTVGPSSRFMAPQQRHPTIRQCIIRAWGVKIAFSPLSLRDAFFWRAAWRYHRSSAWVVTLHGAYVPLSSVLSLISCSRNRCSCPIEEEGKKTLARTTKQILTSHVSRLEPDRFSNVYMYIIYMCEFQSTCYSLDRSSCGVNSSTIYRILLSDFDRGCPEGRSTWTNRRSK